MKNMENSPFGICDKAFVTGFKAYMMKFNNFEIVQNAFDKRYPDNPRDFETIVKELKSLTDLEENVVKKLYNIKDINE